MKCYRMMDAVCWVFGASLVSITMAGPDDHLTVNNAYTTDPYMRTVSYSTELAIDVKGCGKTKGCMRSPRFCQPPQCQHILTWQKVKDKKLVEFELGATVAKDSRWIALGFSDDLKMPGTSVVDCILHTNITIQASYNPDHYNQVLSPNNQLGLVSSRSSGSHVDGFLTCKFTKLMEVHNHTDKVANLSRSYYLFLAEGPTDGQGQKEMHEKIPIKSAKKISVLENSNINIGELSKDMTFTALHGTLMIISWMLLSSVGILSSRHNKTAWNKKVCHKQLWFQIHRTMMTLTALFTVVALALIIFAKKLEPLQEQHLHPILGVIVTALMIFNAVAGVCRPQTGTAVRPVFNWIHCLVGNISHFVAVAVMFFGVRALNGYAHVPDWCQWVVAGFGGWKLLIELIMTAQKYHNKEDLQVAYVEMSGSMDQTRLETEAYIFKNVMSSVYLLGVLCCTIALLIGILPAIFTSVQ